MHEKVHHDRALPPKGRVTSYGYYGRLANGCWIYFATEDEYLQYYNDSKENNNE